MRRLDALREKLDEKSLDAIIISVPENRRYLSGFTGSAGYLVISRNGAVLATDFRYTEQAGNQSPDFQIVRMGADWNWMLDAFKEQGFKKVGFEGHQVPVATYQQMTTALEEVSSSERPNLLSTQGIVEGIRSVKEAEEVSLLQKAIDVADGAMQAIAPNIQPGQTEREIAWNLEKAMRDLGADSPSFDTIVASGPNGAMPHHRPSDRAIQDGDPIVIDMGAKVDGYCSDLSRTVCVGGADETFRKIYDIVLGAQLTAIATVKVGMSGGDADDLSRNVIAEAGYGDNFGHSLGHGVGLVIHEYPRVSPKAENVLEPGMVFTVEPGIYLSGWGGVRIEDIVVLDEKGATVLSKAPK